MFSHEKLVAYQRSIAFVAWSQTVIEALPKTAVRDQLDRASTSIPLNLAEGNVKHSIPDRARFFQTAHGSTMECAACLDVAVARKLVAAAAISSGKNLLEEIARLLSGLLDRLGYRFDEPSSRVREDEAEG